MSNTKELASQIADGFQKLNLSAWRDSYLRLSKAKVINEEFIQKNKKYFWRQVCFILSDSNKNSDWTNVSGGALEYLMKDAIAIVEFEKSRNIANAKLGTLPSWTIYADLIRKIQNLSREVL